MITKLSALLLRLTLAVCAAGSAQAQIQSQERRFWSDGAGSFDYYVLALSWSPSFCAEKGNQQGSAQCSTSRRLGFTVHGLWPQFTNGYPSNCNQGSRFIASDIVSSNRDLFPDEGLLRYQWRKHGACSGSSPVRYFNDTRRAFNKVRIPDTLRNITRPVSMQQADIERAFARSNPGLRPEMMRVMCRRGQLQEVRICFDKDVRGFMSCGRLQRSDCGFTGVQINPAR
ncbi:ribonuclease T2 [Microvirga sp. W0021]|uniref:Ribonuclease T2 n=1 Tax=Hohaiivirga grylli TaxID=3133970 RepID=A0ABV0BK05_9HYPH